jgi:dTDP-glucose 4,6-dehydratase
MRLDDGRVIPNFMKQALTGKDLTVYGDGEQTRSFCYVDDMIESLVSLFESGVDEPVNIGNPDERTINELAEVVLEVTGSDSGVTHEELPPQDPQVRRPDLSKARSEVGWEPAVGLREGLRKSIPYFESQLD